MPLRTPSALQARRSASRGQVVVIFAGAMLLFAMLCAAVVDLSWYWTNNLRMQRAADAAALAGVVYLPGDPTSAYATARAEAVKNGYTDGVGGFTVTPLQDPTNERRLLVSISGPIGTYFARVAGINSFNATRNAKADYVLPVPMGSPENYYGVFGLTRGLTTTGTTTSTNTTSVLGNTGLKIPTASVSGTWTSSSGTIPVAVATDDTKYLQTSTASAQHQLNTWGLTTGGAPLLPNPAANQSLSIVGLEVNLTDTFLSATCANSKVGVDLSWNNGTNWTSVLSTPNLVTNTTTGDYTLPSTNGGTTTSAWGPVVLHTWTRADFTDANLKLRVTATKGCATAGIVFNIDKVEIKVYYQLFTTTTTTTTTTNPIADQNLQGPGTACAFSVANCYVADGAALNPRGFWGTMNTEGAMNVNGDAYQPFYDTSPGTPNPAYDATNYYNYAVEMPAGTTNGSIYVYDPVFCDVATNKGTGDRWFSGSSGVSSFYELYDTKGTLYDITDDGAALATSGGLFQSVAASDTSMGGSGGSECLHSTDAAYGDGRDYHDNWYLLYSGMTGGASGHVYRIHTTSTDPSNVNAQKSTDGENSFALYASATGGTPKLYGLGAMQAFTPLSASGSAVTSEFYLAQIDPAYAGKTVEVNLWDPGDTNPLSASIEILQPTAASWTASTLSWTAAKGTTNSNAANCNSLTGTGVTSIQTNVGATNGTFNGCWLTIHVVIPATYTGFQNGWWKIRYTMNGTGTSNDVTTWTVRILGNPVHLVLP